jgi:tRNA modification GTPase
MSTRASGSSLEVDTIAAIATAPGAAGIGVVRLSGPEALPIAAAVSGPLGEPRIARLRRFRDAEGEVIDSGLVICFSRPNSFTGEDVVEFQGHGGPVVLQMLLGALLEAGARLARPGEFTERAYLNGKMDLAQAEAVADLIASSSATAVRAANRSLAGEFSRQVHALDEQVLSLRVFVEASIDFVDEDIDVLESGDVAGRIGAIQQGLVALQQASAQGVLLRDGISLALLGPPNVGKSSLLNRLAGEERAIVTQVPGTTRDLVRVPVQIGGLPVEMVDTAGLRETRDLVEREGVRRALHQGREADIVLWLTDLTQPDVGETTALEELDQARVIRVGNKLDLVSPGADSISTLGDVQISAVTGAGIEKLVSLIQQRVGYQAPEAAFTARQRHLQALEKVAGHLATSLDLDSGSAELIAEELRLAHLALGEIVGELTPDELLGEIFSNFCIGK